MQSTARRSRMSGLCNAPMAHAVRSAVAAFRDAAEQSNATTSDECDVTPPPVAASPRYRIDAFRGLMRRIGGAGRRWCPMATGGAPSAMLAISGDGDLVASLDGQGHVRELRCAMRGCVRWSKPMGTVPASAFDGRRVWCYSSPPHRLLFGLDAGGETLLVRRGALAYRLALPRGAGWSFRGRAIASHGDIVALLGTVYAGDARTTVLMHRACSPSALGWMHRDGGNKWRAHTVTCDMCDLCATLTMPDATRARIVVAARDETVDIALADGATQTVDEIANDGGAFERGTMSETIVPPPSALLPLRNYTGTVTPGGYAARIDDYATDVEHGATMTIAAAPTVLRFAIVAHKASPSALARVDLWHRRLVPLDDASRRFLAASLPDGASVRAVDAVERRHPKCIALEIGNGRFVFRGSFSK